jgi:hypothetical protein
MKKFLVTAAALALLAGAPAMAQSGGGGGGAGSSAGGGASGPGSSGGSVNRSGSSPAMEVIDNTQRSAIRTYITQERVAVTTLPSNYELSVGSTVPAGVTFRTFPQTVGVANYGYFVAPGGKTVLVEPSSRRVVQIME